MNKKFYLASLFLSSLSFFGQGTKPMAMYPFTGNANSEYIAINGVASGATLTEDRFGNPNRAYKFDGVDDFISLSDNASYQFSNEFTISLWAKWAGKSTGIADGSSILFNREGEYEFGVDSTGTLMWALSTVDTTRWSWIKTNTKLPKNTWSQVLMQYNGSQVKIFLNGTLISQKNKTGAIDEESSATETYDELYIGNRSHPTLNQPFNGSLDLVKIYAKALSPNEIATNYMQESQNPEHFKVAAYPFNNNAKDTIGSIDGTLFGPIASSDRFNKPNASYLYDGSDDYINLGDTSAFTFSRMFTITGWVKRTGSSNTADGSGIIINNEGLYELGVSGDGKLQFAVSTSTITKWEWYTTTAVVPLNQWAQVVLVFNAGIVEAYLNGTLAGTQNLGGVIKETSESTASQNDFRIGGRQSFPAQQVFKGNIDDIAIYNYSLTAAEINALYQEEKPLTTSIDEVSSDAYLAVYPNPSKGILNVESTTSEITSASLMSTTGSELPLVINNGKLDASGQQAGIYLLKVKFSDGSTTVKRVTIQ